MLDLYFLGLEPRVMTLRDPALDHFRRIWNEHCVIPEAGNIEDIYGKTARTSPLRLLVGRMVAHYLFTCNPQGDTEICRQYLCLAEKDDAFRIDLNTAIQYISENRLADPTAGDTEIYHESDIVGGIWSRQGANGGTVQLPRCNSSAGPP